MLTESGIRKILQKILAVINPDGEVVEQRNLLEWSSGNINTTTGEVVEDNTRISSDFIPITPGEFTFKVTGGVIAVMVAYDENKQLKTGWADGENFRYAGNNTIIDIYSGVSYIKLSANATAESETFQMMAGDNDIFTEDMEERKTKFTKVHFKNDYFINTNEIDDDPTMHGMTIARDGSNTEQFNIVGIAAPANQPSESTLSLTNFGNGTTQWVDITSMKYPEMSRGVVGLGIQSRGNTPVPYFDLSFNDGTGAKHNLVVQPDAVPIEFTSAGIVTKLHASDSQTVTVNLVDLLQRIEALEAANSGE